MRKAIELTAINLRSERDLERFSEVEHQAPHEEVIGEDDLERPIVAQTAGEARPAPVLKTYPTMIFVDNVREYHPRQHDRVGTRIVYVNGSAQIVQEEYADVKAKFASLNN